MNPNTVKEKLKKSQEWLVAEFGGIRTGRANPAILDGVKVSSYGDMVPLNQVGSITIEEARTLRISPWDMSVAKEVERAIIGSNLGLSVVTDDKGLRVIFPELTGERREQYVKLAKEKLEQAKIQVRQTRGDVVKDLEKQKKAGGVSEDDVKRSEKDLQKYVDEATKALDELFAKKEKEIRS
jgi:ribosome recycling factor